MGFLSRRFGDMDPKEILELLGPFDYLGMVWAVALGATLFDDWPDATVLAGAAIVISSGLAIAWRERRLGLQKARIRSE